MMTKYVAALVLALMWISWDSGKAKAQGFSSPNHIISSAGVPFPLAKAQIAGASGNPGGLSFEDRFAKNRYEFGLTLGYGFNFNLEPTGLPSQERTRFRFAYFFPNFKYNITGIMGKDVFQGALYWVVEAGAAITTTDPRRNNVKVDDAPNYVFGIVPIQLEYKFLGPERSWAPFLFAGVGGSWGDWADQANEISTTFEFILQTGAGVEYFLSNGTALNIQYRFWHLSNSNVKSRNIGINAHVISLGFSF